MKVTYDFDYINENEFHKLERALRKYNMLAFKKLYFDYYPNFREGNFLGKIVSTNKDDQTVEYELKLPTDNMFSKVYEDIKLHYQVHEDTRIIVLDTITPEDILLEGHKSELIMYKGVLISRKSQYKDMFKIDLLNMIDKK